MPAYLLAERRLVSESNGASSPVPTTRFGARRCRPGRQRRHRCPRGARRCWYPLGVRGLDGVADGAGTRPGRSRRGRLHSRAGQPAAGGARAAEGGHPGRHPRAFHLAAARGQHNYPRRPHVRERPGRHPVEHRKRPTAHAARPGRSPSTASRPSTPTVIPTPSPRARPEQECPQPPWRSAMGPRLSPPSATASSWPGGRERDRHVRYGDHGFRNDDPRRSTPRSRTGRPGTPSASRTGPGSANGPHTAYREQSSGGSANN